MSGVRLPWCVVGLVAMAGCSTSTPQPQPQPTVEPAGDGDQAPPRDEQCAHLIAVINGGIQHVDNEAAKAKAEGKPELLAMGAALARVADELEHTILSEEDLLRLGGFYVGVLRLQSRAMEELSVGLGRGDKAYVEKKQGELETIEKQETAIIDDLNRACPGGLLGEPGAQPVPPSPAPGQPGAPSPAPTAPPPPAK